MIKLKTSVLLKRASVAYDKGEYKILDNILNELLRRGSLDARYMNIRGKMYENGRGVTIDYACAYRNYNASAIKRSREGIAGMKRMQIKLKWDKKQIAEAEKYAHRFLQNLVTIKIKNKKQKTIRR